MDVTSNEDGQQAEYKITTTNVLNFIFEKDGGFDNFYNHKIVQENMDKFNTFILHKLTRIFNAEPLTNIKLKFIDLIDQQHVLDSKHSLVKIDDEKEEEKEVNYTPSFQMFNKTRKRMMWKNIILLNPRQYINVRDRPRDLINLYFYAKNSFKASGNKLFNFSTLAKLQYTKVHQHYLFPQSTRRSKNALAALSFDVPSSMLNELKRNEKTIVNDVEGLEDIVLGQPLKSGVNGVSIISKYKVYST